jgi:hypothetical protein
MKRRAGRVKAHYDGQKMLSKIYFFKIVNISIFTKLILKEVFMNTQSKVVQLPNNAIVNGNYFFINIK